MKKTLLVTALMTLSASTIAANNSSQPQPDIPGFVDMVTVNFTLGSEQTIETTTQSGTLYNQITPKCYTSGSIYQCVFKVTDNDSWDSSGTVGYEISDKQGNVVNFAFSDGALSPNATMHVNYASKGITVSELDRTGQYSYTFDIGQ